MIPHPDWSYSANIYEVNVRQYTHEGTFRAFEKHLPRLKDMGVEILWFIPVTPISKKDRKGTLGSYYAVQNYTAINPEFGSLKDFKHLVRRAHQHGFKIIIDWVANHTGNDNVWINEHPDFFVREANNDIVHPNGWEDVSKLNYDNAGMQAAMVSAMRFWIEECEIDGFRCDMAHLVPLQFWEKAKAELEAVKTDLFWLAECEEPGYHDVFDATYTWKWMHATEDFCKGKTDLQGLFDILVEYDRSFPKEAFRVYFTSNHDENSWNGTEYEKYGEAAKLFAVFSCTWNGIPLIYSGQELPNNKRLKFFDKDEIEWSKCALHDFYKIVLSLRQKNSALRAGDMNVVTNSITTNHDDKIFAFVRKNGNDEVLVLLNFSAESLMAEAKVTILQGMYKNVFEAEKINCSGKLSIGILPWGYKVYQKEKAL